MTAEETAKAKTIILSMVSDAPGATYHMIMERCLDSLYMDFFAFSQCYKELLNSNLLEKVSESDGTDNKTADSSEDILYITAGGSAILEDIRHTLPQSILLYLEETKTVINEKIAKRNSIKAYIESDDTGMFAVLTINDEKGCSFMTKVRCEDREHANIVCAAFKNNASSIHDSVSGFISE